MNTSTDEIAQEPTQGRASYIIADGLTLVRVLLGPVIAGIIIYGWPLVAHALLASVLFGLGALTDLLDDILGGSKRASRRVFGWVDDIADAVLIGFALLALLYVTQQNGILGWAFAVPALIYISRDVAVGVVKGFEFSVSGRPESRLGTLKNALAMLGVGLMIASPWLQLWIDRLRAGDNGEALMNIYDAPSPWVWQCGQALLWVAAILALITMIQHFTRKANS